MNAAEVTVFLVATLCFLLSWVVRMVEVVRLRAERRLPGGLRISLARSFAGESGNRRAQALSNDLVTP